MPERRDVLPIPDLAPVGVTTYDAKDPETAFAPIEVVPRPRTPTTGSSPTSRSGSRWRASRRPGPSTTFQPEGGTR
jgi:hypothetical protein